MKSRFKRPTVSTKRNLNILLSRFLRVNKIAMKKFLRILSLELDFILYTLQLVYKINMPNINGVRSLIVILKAYNHKLFVYVCMQIRKIFIIFYSLKVLIDAVVCGINIVQLFSTVSKHLKCKIFRNSGTQFTLK